MCTLTIVKKTNGYIVYMNRDERHERPEETSPSPISNYPSITAPIDTLSGGTWIASSTNKHWGCLLNGYFDEPKTQSPPAKSRGMILPEILSTPCPFKAAKSFDPSGFASFRLVIGSVNAHKLFVYDGCDYSEQSFHASFKERIFFLTSSSWEQERVIDARKKLFLNEAPYITETSIPEYHLKRTTLDAYTSPFMHRDYSRTKSITTLTVDKSGSSFNHTLINRNDVMQSN